VQFSSSAGVEFFGFPAFCEYFDTLNFRGLRGLYPLIFRDLLYMISFRFYNKKLRCYMLSFLGCYVISVVLCFLEKPIFLRFHVSQTVFIPCTNKPVMGSG